MLAIVDAVNYPYEQQLLTTLIAELTGEALSVWQQWHKRYLLQLQQVDKQQVLTALQNNNPVYVLRNSMAQRAIDAAEQGEFAEVERVYQLLANPYQVQAIAVDSDSTAPAPNAVQQPISCSS